MKRDKEKTTVVFRVWRSGDGKGKVIALFPGIDYDGRGLYCSSFEHIGQHGAASYTGTIRRSRPATPAEYADVKRELTKEYGYNLEARKRRTS